MIELFIGIVEAIVALVAGLIEAIASVFVAGGEALGAGEAIVVLLAFLIELVFWFFLWCIELVVALFQWRRPKKVPKPVIWRPNKKQPEQEKSAE